MHQDEIKDVVRQAVKDAIIESHTCYWADSDDQHDLRQLLSIYRESTSAVRKWAIKLILWGAFAVMMLGAAFALKKSFPS